MKKDKWYLYVVRTTDNFFYTGISLDVDRRFAEHQSSGSKGARFFRVHKAEAIVFRQFIGNQGVALKLERKFKSLPRTKKEFYIKQGFFDFNQI